MQYFRRMRHNYLLSVTFRLYDSKTKIEVAPKASIYDSAIKLDPQNSQFILFYQEGNPRFLTDGKRFSGKNLQP